MAVDPVGTVQGARQAEAVEGSERNLVGELVDRSEGCVLSQRVEQQQVVVVVPMALPPQPTTVTLLTKPSRYQGHRTQLYLLRQAPVAAGLLVSSGVTRTTTPRAVPADEYLALLPAKGWPLACCSEILQAGYSWSSLRTSPTGSPRWGRRG
jgi:hypothetical protein